MVEVGGDHGLVQRERVDPEEREEEVGAELEWKIKKTAGLMLENKGLKSKT